MNTKLQYITQNNPNFTHAEQVAMMYRNGIKWVQLRIKNTDKSVILQQAKEAMQYACSMNGVLIINDHVEICREVAAHGVHLGLTDMSVAQAREILGTNAIIGGTANTIDDIELHARQGADYVGLGPFRYTTTKQNLSPIIGAEGYRKIRAEMEERNLKIPIVAVGGITLDDLPFLDELGFGAAISSALLKKYLKNPC